MYIDTYIDYKHQVMTDRIENEMQRTKDQALKNLSKIVHFEIETFLRVFAFSFFEQNDDAQKLADKLNLGKLDFLAALDDYDGFKEEYYRDLELAQIF